MLKFEWEVMKCWGHHGCDYLYITASKDPGGLFWLGFSAEKFLSNEKMVVCGR